MTSQQTSTARTSICWLFLPTSDNFEYVVGLFYSDIQYDRDFARGPIFSADWVAKTGTESVALYAQGTWSLSDRTDITAGLRLNSEDISHDFDNALTGCTLKAMIQKPRPLERSACNTMPATI